MEFLDHDVYQQEQRGVMYYYNPGAAVPHKSNAELKHLRDQEFTNYACTYESLIRQLQYCSETRKNTLQQALENHKQAELCRRDEIRCWNRLQHYYGTDLRKK